jgi:hypothetical protein
MGYNHSHRTGYWLQLIAANLGKKFNHSPGYKTVNYSPLFIKKTLAVGNQEDGSKSLQQMKALYIVSYC